MSRPNRVGTIAIAPHDWHNSLAHLSLDSGLQMRVIRLLLSATLLLSLTVVGRAQSQPGETVYALVSNSVFSLRIANEAGVEVGTATGFVVDGDLVLTNAHVANASRISIQAGPIAVACEVERIDVVNDLALCRMAGKASVPALRL